MDYKPAGGADAAKLLRTIVIGASAALAGRSAA